VTVSLIKSWRAVAAGVTPRAGCGARALALPCAGAPGWHYLAPARPVGRRGGAGMVN